MHHWGSQRASQWRNLTSGNPTWQVPNDSIVLSDFNSIIIPGRDTASSMGDSVDAPSATSAAQARDSELEFIRSRELFDAYPAVHSERMKVGLGGLYLGF